MADSLLPKIVAAYLDIKKKANQAVEPVVSAIQNSPGADLLRGHPEKVLPKIQSNISKQSNILHNASNASMKRVKGQTPTAQDLADETAGIQTMQGMATGTIGEAPVDEAAPTKYTLGATEGVDPKTGLPVGGRLYGRDRVAVNPQEGQDIVNPAPQQPQVAPEAAPEPAPPPVPHPDVPDSPVEITQRTGAHPLTGGNPVLVDLRDEAKKNGYYFDDQTKSREVMDKYVPGNTPLEVEQELPKTLNEETKRIQNIMSQNPGKTANVSDLITQNEINLTKKGIKPGISSSADSATREALNTLDSQIADQSNLPGKTTITGDELINYKNILDDQLESAYKKSANGTSLTPGENAMRTLRRTINDQLKLMYPGMGDALDRQTAMIDAIPSVAKAAGTAEKDATAIASEPKPTLGDKLGEFSQSIPGKIAGAVLLGEGFRGGQDLPKIVNGAIATVGKAGSEFLNSPFMPRIGASQQQIQSSTDTNKSKHDQSISYQFPDVKPDPNTGEWSWEQKQAPGGSFMTEQQFQDATVNKGILSGPIYNALNDKLQESKANANAVMGRNGGKVYDFMSGAREGFTGSTNAIKNIDSLPSGFWNAWKPGLDIKAYSQDSSNPRSVVNAMGNIESINDKFSDLYSDMNNNKAPDNNLLIQPGDSSEQIKGKLNQQAALIKGYYTEGGDYPGQFQDAYLAKTTPTGTDNQQANNSAIQSSPSVSESGNTGFPIAKLRGSGITLPPIGQ